MTEKSSELNPRTPAILQDLHKQVKTAKKSATKPKPKGKGKGKTPKQPPLNEKAEGPPIPAFDIDKLAEEFLYELSRPIISGNWHVTDVFCRNVHYWEISHLSDQELVHKGATRETVLLYGMRRTVKLADIVAVRVGYLPHFMEPHDLPAFLLVHAPGMIHEPATTSAIVRAFKASDMKKVTEAVQESQVGIMRAYAYNMAQSAKTWMQIANQKVMDAKAMTDILVRFWMLLMRGVDERMKQMGGMPWTTRVKNFVSTHKKALAIGIPLIVFIGIAAALLFFFFTQAMALPFLGGGG